MKTTRLLRWTLGSALSLVLALALGACALHPEPPPRLFDFGPLPSIGAASVDVGGLVHVVASEDLDGALMRYRLLYADPRNVLAYRDSRWVSAPAQLLRARLLAAKPLMSDGGEAWVELQAFEQEFSAPERSELHLSANVSWERGGVRHGAQFDVRVNAAADASGFAAAAGPACDQLTAQVRAAIADTSARP